MLSAPVLKGWLGKWMFALSEFDIRYQPAKAVKGQALVDLVANRISTDIAALFIRVWAMFLTDRLVMMDAVWEFCWCRLEGRLTPFPSE